MSNELSQLAGQLLKAAVRTVGNPLYEAIHEEMEPRIQQELDQHIQGPTIDRIQTGVDVTRRVIERTRQKMRERATA